MFLRFRGEPLTESYSDGPLKKKEKKREMKELFTNKCPLDTLSEFLSFLFFSNESS